MIAFIHIEKSAGTTVDRILRRSFGLSHCDVEPWDQSAPFFSSSDYERLRKVYPRLRSIAGHSVMPHSDLGKSCPDIKYFTFLRDPLSRSISHYQNNIELCGYDINLGDWLHYEAHNDFQTRKLAGTDSVDRAIAILQQKVCFVGLLERFDESLVMLSKSLGSNDLNIRYTVENITKNREFKARLLNDPAKREMLDQSIQRDKALYDYVVNTLYPRQVEQYGKTLKADVEAFLKEKEISFHEKIPGYANFLYRNLLYKPSLKLYRKRHHLQIKRWPKY